MAIGSSSPDKSSWVAGHASRRVPGFVWPLLALVIGVGLVVTYDQMVASARYLYSSDSASYIEMAQSLRDGHWPTVVPWGVESPADDHVTQPLFAPGFTMLAAALAPLMGGVKAAVAYLPRCCAALLPLLLMLGFRRLIDDALLLPLGIGLLGTQGLLYWHYVGYSDVPGLFVAVAALGALWQTAWRIAAKEPSAVFWAIGAGMLAGLCYAVRNAGLAVVASGLLYWCLAYMRDRCAMKFALAWCLGCFPILGLLKLYSLVVFGLLSPYSMPASTRAWSLNLADWVSAQINDWQLRGPDAPALSLSVSVAVIFFIVAGVGYAMAKLRHERVKFASSLLLPYVLVGGAMVVIARSRYEWGGSIDTRHALQYTFALWLLLVVILQACVKGWWQTVLPVLAWIWVGGVGWCAWDTAQAEVEAPEEMQLLALDSRLMAAISDLDAKYFLVSNQAALLRTELTLPARQVDFIGDDQQFRETLAQLAATVRPRPVAFLMACEPWTMHTSWCAPDVPLPEDLDCQALRAASPKVVLCRARDKGRSS